MTFIMLATTLALSNNAKLSNPIDPVLMEYYKSKSV